MASRLIETYYLTGLNFYIRVVLAWILGVGMLIGGGMIYIDSKDMFGVFLLLFGGFFVVVSGIGTWKVVTKRTWVEVYNDHLEIQYGFFGNKHTSWKWDEVGALFNQGKGVYILQKKEPSKEQVRLESLYPKEMWYEIVTRSPGIGVDEDVHRRIHRLLESHDWNRPPQ